MSGQEAAAEAGDEWAEDGHGAAGGREHRVVCRQQEQGCGESSRGVPGNGSASGCSTGMGTVTPALPITWLSGPPATEGRPLAALVLVPAAAGSLAAADSLVAVPLLPPMRGGMTSAVSPWRSASRCLQAAICSNSLRNCSSWLSGSAADWLRPADANAAHQHEQVCTHAAVAQRCSCLGGRSGLCSCFSGRGVLCSCIL